MPGDVKTTSGMGDVRKQGDLVTNWCCKDEKMIIRTDLVKGISMPVVLRLELRAVKEYTVSKQCLIRL